MASLRVPHLRQLGNHGDARENGVAEALGARPGPASASRRFSSLNKTALPRRGRRFRTGSKRYGVISRSMKACGARNGRDDHAAGPDSAPGASGPLQQVCRLLRAESPDELQDLIASLILSECVYKKLELDEEGVAAKITEFVSGFPPGWVQLQAVQLSLPGIPQHYLIAISPTSMYVAFMGTKQFQDLLADANLLHTPIWAESARLAADRQSIPAAHRGFLERARAIHVEQLYELAVSRGLRLVLCGHSLGGAVAKLCTLRLLRELPDWPRPRVRCIAFATPAVGNAALAELVESAGWAGHFATYYLPEDQLVRLISFSQARTSSVSSTAAAAAIGGRGGGGGGARNGGVWAERRRRAKDRAAQRDVGGGGGGRSLVAGGEGGEETSGAEMAAPAPEVAVASPAGTASSGLRLDEAALGRLGASSGRGGSGRATVCGPAAPGTAAEAVGPAADAAAATPQLLQPPLRVPRVLSSSSIASASSCASLAASAWSGSSRSSAGSSPAGSSDGINSGSFRPGGSSLGSASTGSALEARDASASPSSPSSGLQRSISSVSRNSSGDGDCGSSLTGLLAPPSGVAVPNSAVEATALAAATSAAAAVQPQDSAAASTSLTSPTESLDEEQGKVAQAMEEILAPGPDEMEAAAAARVALCGQPPMDMAAAQREALYGNAGGSWGLRLALGRKRVMRRLRRLAARARIPLPKALLPVSRYHTFGEQWFVTEHGAMSPGELEAAVRQQREQQDQQQQQQLQPAAGGGAPVPVALAAPQASQTAAAATGGVPTEGTRGFFSFHRMVAYRQRHTDLIARLVRSADLAQGQTVAGLSEASSQPPPSSVAVGASGSGDGCGSGGLAAVPASVADTAGSLPYSAVQLSDSLLPRISVQHVVLRGVLLEASAPAGLQPGDAGADPQPSTEQRLGGYAAAAPTSTASAAVVAPMVSHLLSWVRGGGGGSGGGGGRIVGADEPVRLDLELEGRNLQYCRKVSVALVRDGVDAPAVPPAAAAAATGGMSLAAATAAAATASQGVTATAAVARQAVPAAAARAAGAWVGRWAPFVPSTMRSGTSGVVAGGSSGTVTKAGRVDVVAAAPLPQLQIAARETSGGRLNPPLPSPAAEVQPQSQSPPSARAPSPPSLPSAGSPSSQSCPESTSLPAAGPPVAASLTANSPATEVACEVVQVLYAQPYSDAANPPPLHPVSLFRNTLHHLAGSLMRRCRLPTGGATGSGQGGPGREGLEQRGVAAGGAASAAMAGGAFAPPQGFGGYGGTWRSFRFQPTNLQRPTDTSSAATAASSSGTGAGSSGRRPGSGGGFGGHPGQANLGLGQSLRGFREAAASWESGGGSGAGGSGVPGTTGPAAAVHAVVEMPSRLLLRVTLPRSVARGLLEGTLPGRLVVSARSDFHALSTVPVVVHRPRVAILGTSPYSASLVQAVLSAPAALAAASLDERTGSGGAAGAAGAIAGAAAWVPPPVAWALAAVCQRVSTRAARAGGAVAAVLDAARAAQGVERATASQSAVAVAEAGAGGCVAAAPAVCGSAVMSGSSSPSQGHAARCRAVSPSWLQLSAQAVAPRLRARLGKLRWGIRQSLAAAAVGVAAASAAGVSGAAAAVGAAAVMASTMAALSSDAGASVLAQAVVKMAAVVAAAAAAATAFSGSEAAVVVAAAASAAAVAMAAASSSSEGISRPPLLPSQQQPQAASEKLTSAAAPCSAGSPLASRSSKLGPPISLTAPRLGAALGAQDGIAAAGSTSVASEGSVGGNAAASDATRLRPAAAPKASTPQPQAPRWVIRFGARPGTTGQGGSRGVQSCGGSGSGGAAGWGAAAAAAGGALRPVGRGWTLWWQERDASPCGDGMGTGVRAASTAVTASPLPPASGQWLSWPLPGAATAAASGRGGGGGGTGRGPLAAGRAPVGPATTVTAACSAASTATGKQSRPSTAATAASASVSAASASPAAPHPSPWFAAAALRHKEATTAVPYAVASAEAAAAGSGHARPISGGAAAAAESLARLRARLLSSLQAGSGRAALPLPPAVLSDGLELCNVMVEPVSRTWGSGRAGAAAAAAGQHLLPRQPPLPRGGAAVAVAPVPASLLWKQLCRGPPAGTVAEPASAATATSLTAAAAAGSAPPPVDPRAAATAARAALDGAAATAAAAAAAAAAALGVVPTGGEGYTELVGVAPLLAARRLEDGLRRQVLLRRGLWWRALLGGVVGALMRPVALVGMLGRLPGWGLMQVLRRGQSAAAARGAATAATAAVGGQPPHLRTTPLGQSPGGLNTAGSPAVAASSSPDSSGGGPERQAPMGEWCAVVVVASCRDPLRSLRGRDMEALRARAADAACPLVPVLLSCAESPPGRRATALRALAAACGVAPAAVVEVGLEAALLHQPAAAIPRADLAEVWRDTASCGGGAELRRAVWRAVAAAAAEAATAQQQQYRPAAEEDLNVFTSGEEKEQLRWQRPQQQALTRV